VQRATGKSFAILIPIVRNLPPIRVGRTQICERRSYFLVLAGCLLNIRFQCLKIGSPSHFGCGMISVEKNPNWAQVEAGIALLR
jgi:hypothetical protein